MTDIEQRGIATIRGLAMDAPHAARSGHQGTAMSLAPLAHVLWTRIMRYDAADPHWPDRDRFVLSAGHASILLYSMLHLTGQGLELEDIKQFRQWDSRTPGHPEVHHTAGVEVTTGPLGQGFANAVGMAMAERSLRTRFGADVCDHRTFVVAGDGCLSEGISHEAASLAGHQQLGRLIAIYDDNHITIDGKTELALNDDAGMRFEAYGWHVERVGEIGEDLDALEAAIRRAIAVEDRPSLIVLRTHIAFPSAKVNDPATHGYALFDDEIAATKTAMGIPADEKFWVPDDVLAWYRGRGERGRADHQAWLQRLAASADRTEFDACYAGQGFDGWQQKLPTWEAGSKAIATRVASGNCLEALVDVVPGLVGGGADLTGNTGTVIKGHGVLGPDEPAGRQIHFGVREHGMGGVMTGMALHGGAIPVGGTFLVFSDYMRGAIRLAALSQAHVIYSFTHDSVGVGEDGPTHQPVEHVAALRAIPDLRVIRPADANETAQAWVQAVNGPGPTALILSRQNLPVLEGTGELDGVARGAYTLVDSGADTPDVVLVGTGSEVSLCVDAAAALAQRGVVANVVSMPCWSLFEAQSNVYRDSVLPDGVPTVSIEAGSTMGWARYADVNIGIDRFGASAPGDVVLDKLGMNTKNLVEHTLDLLGLERS